MTQSNESHGRLLAIHSDEGALAPILEALAKRGFDVAVVSETSSEMSHIEIMNYQAVLIREPFGSSTAVEIAEQLRADGPDLGHPIIALCPDEPTSELRVSMRARGISESLCEYADPDEIANIIETLITAEGASMTDHITGLISGPALARRLESLSMEARKEWYFIEVKLLGIKPYNLQKGYDLGDELLKGLGELLTEIAAEYGSETDFVGRLFGPRFCIVAEPRKVESVCRTIKTKSERFFRNYYSSFEWMKGYLTVEGGNSAGDYYLCELLVAAVHVPSNWGNSLAYLLDIAEEVLAKVDKTRQGYLIARP
ncbi:MAG TPA: diguanylate cyclase [bacterium]|nr:diguanylate cyclase [bacterium]